MCSDFGFWVPMDREQDHNELEIEHHVRLKGAPCWMWGISRRAMHPPVSAHHGLSDSEAHFAIWFVFFFFLFILFI